MSRMTPRSAERFLFDESLQGCVPECLAIAVGTADHESAVRFAAKVRGRR